MNRIFGVVRDEEKTECENINIFIQSRQTKSADSSHSIFCRREKLNFLSGGTGETSIASIEQISCLFHIHIYPTA